MKIFMAGDNSSKEEIAIPSLRYARGMSGLAVKFPDFPRKIRRGRILIPRLCSTIDKMEKSLLIVYLMSGFTL